MMDHDTIRQAAILIDSLAPTQAEDVLQRLDAEEAARIRQAVGNLSAEDLKSSKAVIKEFLASCTPETVKATPSTEPKQTIETAKDRISGATYSPFGETKPFDFQFLYQVSPPLIAQFLGKLHKQIAAVILSRMPSDLSGVVISYLPEGQQSEILERINSHDECELSQLQTVTRLLKDCLMHIGESQTRLPPQLTSDAIEQVARDNFLNRTLTDIESNGTDLSHLEHLHARKRQAGPIDACSRSLLQDTYVTEKETLRFEDIVLLNDNSLAKLFHHINHETLLLALAGAPTEVIQRITSPLTNQQTLRFTEKIEQLTGVSLQQIENAQQIIADQATRMAQEKTIQFLEQKPFRAAA